MGRGPSYPYVGLEDAIALTRKMYEYAKRAPAPVESIVTDAWKYSTTSSSGQKVLAALKSFGLVEDAPGSSGKSLKITARAVRVLLDNEDSQERKEELKRAALSPRWYEFCWRTWGKEMPPSMRSNLMIEHGFVESTVDGFLRDYRKSIAFAGLLDDALFGKPPDGNDEAPRKPTIGDYVQWESQGTLRMPTARKLINFSPDGAFGFVESSGTGIPVAELILADVSEIPEADVTVSPPAKKMSLSMQRAPTMLQETFSLPDGTSVSIQWPAAFTPEAFEDFSDWLNIVKRKIGRTIKQSNPEGGRDEVEISNTFN